MKTLLMRRLIRVTVALTVGAMATAAGVSIVAGHSPEHATSAPSVFDIVEGFEGNPLSFWELTGHANGPRWNLVTNTQTYGKAYGGVRSMWFGDPATGEFGGEGCDDCKVYSGTLTYKDLIPIPAGDTLAYLIFWSWERTEMSIPTLECYQQVTCTFDSRQVWISGTITPTWKLLWDSRATPTIENQWHSVSIDIREYLGDSVRVRFKFDTIDGRNNDASNQPPAGWYVDDVRFLTFTPSEFVYLPIIFKNKTP